MIIPGTRATILAQALHDALDMLQGMLKPGNAHNLRILADDLEMCAAERDTAERDFLQHCEAKREAARDPGAREFWQRLAGSVRKASRMA